MLVQNYPVDIFGTWFRVVVTGLIPVAFMNYYPSIKLLGKEEQLNHGFYLVYASLIIAAALLLLASFIWKKALSRYSSSGS